jgi:hypothetical protein
MRILLITLFVIQFNSFAFKITSHVSTANETMDILFGSEKESSPEFIQFEASGKIFEVGVSYKYVYDAIRKNPNFFRGGVVGPDGFPDAIGGQIYEHSNETSVGKSLVKSATSDEITIPDKVVLDKLEDREWPSQFRSIDWAMKILEHWKSYNFANEKRRAESLAFVMGYISHCLGDAFMHTWVNAKAHGAWEYLDGKGLYGPLSEEIKHIAIEGYADYHVPKNRLSTNPKATIVEYDRATVRAPVEFLDSFYGKNANLPVAYGDKNSKDHETYFKYYKIPERYYGGAIYSLFNAQYDLADAILNWSDMEELIDMANRGVPGDDAILSMLNTLDWPNQKFQKFNEWLSGDGLEFLTNGFLNCSEGEHTDFQKVKLVYEYLRGFKSRLNEFKEKARISRLNWMVMSECSARNFAQLSAPNYSTEHPDKNRDFCTKYAENAENDIWGDATGEGIFKGSVTDQEFLTSIIDAFKTDTGFVFFDTTNVSKADGPTFEQSSKHRSFIANINRQLGYGLNRGLFIDEMFHVIVPFEGPGQKRKTWYAMCDYFKNDGRKNCTKAQLFPLVATYEVAECAVDHAKCMASGAQACAVSACKVACYTAGGNLLDWAGVGCTDLCSSAEGLLYESCTALKNKSCYVEACVGIGDYKVCTPDVEIPYCVSTFNEVCDVTRPGQGECTDFLTNCGKFDVGLQCSYEAVEETFDDLGVVDEVHSRMTQVCDAVDRSTEKWQRYDEPIERLEFLKRQGIPVDEFILWKNQMGLIKDRLRTNPPSLLVNIAFLKEDIASEEYRTAIEERLTQHKSETNGITDANVKEKRIEFENRFDRILNNDEHPFGETDQDILKHSTSFVNMILKSGIMNDLPGPTAKQAASEFGDNLPETFDPYYNTIQAIKLIGLTSQEDIDSIYTNAGLNHDYLPWSPIKNIYNRYSDNCRNFPNFSSSYCDILKSNDDPNCLDCSEEQFVENDLGWTPGKGVVLWNEYDPTGKKTKNFLSNFLFANTQEAYDKLYTKIFRVPKHLPKSFSFDGEPEDLWVSEHVNIEYDQNTKTEGLASMEICEDGWFELKTSRFNTTEMEIFSNEISIDVFIPEGQLNPWWLGNMSLVLKVPAAGVWWSHLGFEEFTGLASNQWHTLKFKLSDEALNALQGDFSNASLSITANINPSTQGCFHLDNMRFTGVVLNRTVFHKVGAEDLNLWGNSIMSFDQTNDWQTSDNTALVSEGNLVEEGIGATSVDINGWISVKSVEFSTNSLEQISDKINLSLFVPKPQPSQWWVGNVSLGLSCPSANLWDVNLGQQGLQWVFQGEYNSLLFDLTPAAINALKTANVTCQWKINLSLNNQAGVYILDNMGFVNPIENTLNDAIDQNQIGFLCDDIDCQSAQLINSGQSNVLVSTSSKWFVVNGAINGWQANQLGGRDIFVNGQQVTAGQSLSSITPYNGKYYFHFTIGENTWTEFSFW